MKTIQQLFPIDATGTLRAGMLILPDDYLTNPDLLPLVVFGHGVGEVGDGTINTLNLLFNNGSPLYEASQGLLNGIVCPITGKTYRFAAFGLQGAKSDGWDVGSDGTIYALQQVIKAYPMIDTTNIGITGLSAGGETTVEILTGSKRTMFVCAVPMSPEQYDISKIDFTLPGPKVWQFHGDQDGGQTAYWNSQNLNNLLNAAKPGYAFLSTMVGEGHGPWAAQYATSYQEKLPVIINGVKKSLPMNIYQFQLACHNSTLLFTAAGDVAGSTNTPPVNTPLKAVASINIVKGIGTFDPTASAGNATAFWWTITPPAGAKNPWWTDGRNDGGIPAIKTLNGLTPGSWIFALTIQSGAGIATTPYTIIIDATNSGNNLGTVNPPPVSVKTVVSVGLSVISGATVATITWSDGTTTTYQ